MAEQRLRFYLKKNSAIVDPDGDLEGLDNLVVSLFKEGCSDIFVHGVGYSLDRKRSRDDAVIPGTKERGKYLEYVVKES